jgi:hypothetical protein
VVEESWIPEVLQCLSAYIEKTVDAAGVQGSVWISVCLHMLIMETRLIIPSLKNPAILNETK